MQRSLRVPVAKIIAPFVKTLVKLGVSANIISAVGGIGSIVSDLYFFPKGDFFIGVIFVCVFVLFDLFDGAVARQSAKGVSKWGALLDSTLDRLSDAAILLGAMIYYIDSSDDRMQKKVRNAQLEKIPFMMIAGDEDVAVKAVSFRYRNGEQKNQIPIKDAIAEVLAIVKDRKQI